MPGVRFLSLMAIVAALFLARAAVSVDLANVDRADLPVDSGDDQGGLDDDGADLALLPSGTPLTAVTLPMQRLCVEPERAPAPSPFAASIFRPPTSSLA